MKKLKLPNRLIAALLSFFLLLASLLFALWSINGHKGFTFAACLPLIMASTVVVVYLTYTGSKAVRMISTRPDDPGTLAIRNEGIVNALPDMVFVIDRHGHYKDFVDSARGDSIVNPSEFISKKVSDVLPSHLATEVMAFIDKVLTTGQLFSHHYQLEVRGELRSFESRYVPHGENNVMIVVRDMTEAKRAERRIIESEQKYRTLVEQGTDSIFIANFQGHFLVVNPAGCELTQYSESELLRMRFHELLAPEELMVRPVQLSEITSGKTVTSQRTMKRKDGHYLNVEVAARMIAPNRLLAFVRDITERKKTEHELMRSSKHLRELNSYIESVRETEKLNVSREIHEDLGQQLAVLRMDLSRLAKRFSHKETALVNEITGLLESTGRMIDTVRKIALELRPSMLDDIGLMATLEWYCGDFSRRTGIDLSFGTDIPDGSFNNQLNLFLFRIIQESLINIANYSGAGRIDISVKLDDAGLLLVIEDDGKDVRKTRELHDQSPRIAAMMERARMIHGSYELQHLPGKGSVIRVSVPLNRPV